MIKMRPKRMLEMASDFSQIFITSYYYYLYDVAVTLVYCSYVATEEKPVKHGERKRNSHITHIR